MHSNSTTTSPLAQAALTEALSLNGGAWSVQCSGLDAGDYLVTAPGEAAHVVTVSTNYRHETFYACTCSTESFFTPTQDCAGCLHTDVVALFISLRVEVLAGALGRQVRWLKAAIRARIDGQGDKAREDRLAVRCALLQHWYNQRKAATVRIIPRRITEATEGAQAPSLAGWLVLRPVAPILVAVAA